MASDDLWVARLLSGMTDLRPEADQAPVPMPEEVWSRLQAALAEEQQQERVVHLVPRLGRNRSRVLGALVAAAVLGIIAGLTISQMRSSEGGIVADARVAAPENAVASAPLAAQQQDAPQAGVQAASLLPVRKMVASGTDYSAENLDVEVADLMKTAGLKGGQPIDAIPQQEDGLTIGEWGFTASMDGLRSCIFALTKSQNVPALLVDRATLDGSDVALVLTAVPDPGTVLLKQVDIWVVDPGCSSGSPLVIQHFRQIVPQ